MKINRNPQINPDYELLTDIEFVHVKDLVFKSKAMGVWDAWKKLLEYYSLNEVNVMFENAMKAGYITRIAGLPVLTLKGKNLDSAPY